MKFLTSALAILASAAGISAQSTTACNTPTTLIVSQVSNNQYVFTSQSGANLGSNPTLVLTANTAYTFIVSAVQTTDPLYIKTSTTGGGANNLYVAGSNTQTYGVIGNGGQTVQFAPDASLVGTTLYYQDGLNSAAQGQITFVSSATCGGTNPATSAPTAAGAATVAATTAAATTTAAPTTANAAAGTNAPYYLSTPMGCYTDNIPSGTRLFANNPITFDAAFTPQKCSDAAYGAGYTYYALENGNQCWAGNVITTTAGGNMYLNATLGQANQCTTACSGQAASTCGGFNAASVFMITRPPMPTTVTSTAVTFAPGAQAAGVTTSGSFANFYSNVTMMVTAAQYALAQPQADLLPVYAPFSGASMAVLYLNCPNSQCITANQMVYLCIDAESCGYVGSAGFFTIPIVGNAASTIFNKLRLLGTNGAYGDYFLTVQRFAAPTTAAPTTAVPTSAGPQTSAPVCYTDSYGYRVLPNLLGTNALMTPAMCQALAQPATGTKYAFYGVEYGVECYGSNSLQSNVVSNACTMQCPGNAAGVTTTCGGIYAINVYEVYTPNNAITTGCYVDSSANRVLLNLLISSATANSVDACRTAAVAAGYTYYGVEYSSQCWADYAPAYTPLTTSTGCNMACSGNVAQTCGGFNAISLYSTITASATTAAGAATVAATTAAGTVAATTAASATIAGAATSAACSGASYQVSQSTNANGWTIAGQTGDNPTLTVAINSALYFVNNAYPSNVLYIWTTNNYATGQSPSTSGAATIPSNGAASVGVVFRTAGTYYYVSSTNANQHGTIIATNQNC